MHADLHMDPEFFVPVAISLMTPALRQTCAFFPAPKSCNTSVAVGQGESRFSYIARPRTPIVGQGQSLFSYITRRHRVHSPKSPDNPHIQPLLNLIYMVLATSTMNLILVKFSSVLFLKVFEHLYFRTWLSDPYNSLSICLMRHG
jgi:hypothetical protein